MTTEPPFDFERLRDKWHRMLTGGTDWDLADPDLTGIAARIAASASAVWEAMRRTGGRGRRCLWDDLADPGNSAELTANYGRIRSMALACRTFGSPLYRDERLEEDIASALEWMHANRYNPERTRYGNWWDWDIGAPLALNDCLALMHDRLPAGTLSESVGAVVHFKPGVPPNSTGANRVWECTVMAVSGILGRNAARIAEARRELSAVFPYAEDGDGFYEDGSFIQHGHFAYTGGYGQSLIHDLANLTELLHDTPWQLSEAERERVCRWFRDAYEPLVFRGAMMDMTMGRVISRRHSQNHDIGHIVIRAAIRLSRFAPPAEAEAIRRAVKAWIRSDTYRDFYSGASMSDAIGAKAILNDERIPPRGEPSLHKTYARMARSVHLRPGYAFGVSMHSCRSPITNRSTGKICGAGTRPTE